jgi:hypothetical protein
MKFALARRSLTFLSCALLAAPAALADTPALGFEIEALPMPTGVPFFGSVTCTLPGGDLAIFDGTSVTQWTAGGAFVQTVAMLAEGGYAAFILPVPDGSGVVFAHSGDFFAGVQGEIFEAPLSGAGATSLFALKFPYDAIFLQDGDLLVSGDFSGTAQTNDFVRIHLATTGVTLIGQVDGPSGPIAQRANGDLFYAPATNAFPAPPGSGSIVYWTEADLTGGTFLDDTNSTLWASGYDPIAAMRVDPVKDRVFVAENLYDSGFTLQSARVLRARTSVALAEEIAVATQYVSNLEFVNTEGGAANFQSYQPGNGWSLKYNTTDFFSSATHDRIRPLRPTLSLSGPGVLGVGSVTLDVVDAPPNGTLYLVFGPQSQMSPTEETYAHPGYLFHTHLDPTSLKRVPFFLPTDAAGHGSFTLYNPGSLAGLFGYQFLVGDGTGTLVGSSNDAIF